MKATLSLSLSRELSPASVTSCAWAGAFFKFKLVRRPPAAGAPPPPGETCSLSSKGFILYTLCPILADDT